MLDMGAAWCGPRTPKETNVKTARQIKNAYERAAADAHKLASASQIVNFAAAPAQLASERGGAACAAGFAAQALANLANGDYDKFLTDLRLAGQFANEASDEYLNRTRKPL